ncbi:MULTISPECIES: hypothetical protein [unclassified Okeania]|uniref:hypothetical protein n=1 Tax=unclassified Okeania TaxID=2634635 RepID=UPI0013BD35EB|nr:MULTISPECIES: hypothetical protein [unclassified Okeania]NES79913.1 hypothetical protein [Okeania sp. SIO1H4]NET14357.1 hypothetical protein [Okeania sp. SIO1H6]NET19373.1 hypothetical protein [Okeania sp. SIO1H5]NET97463.1 hypothetical protein [Okeania sp. SIO1H2]
MSRQISPSKYGIDLQPLRSTENIKAKGDEPWAYESFGVGDRLKLVHFSRANNLMG